MKYVESIIINLDKVIEEIKYKLEEEGYKGVEDWGDRGGYWVKGNKEVKEDGEDELRRIIGKVLVIGKKEVDSYDDDEFENEEEFENFINNY